MTDGAGAPALLERMNMIYKVSDSVVYQGEAAIVTAVNADGSFNLRVFHADGTDSAPAGVTLDVADTAHAADAETTAADFAA